jgi:copper homeostasis protein
VLEGLDLITELVQKADDRIIIMPGAADITERNINKIVTQSGVKEVHMLGTVSVESPMRFRNPRIFMGGELRPPEFARMVTDANRVNAFRQAVG